MNIRIIDNNINIFKYSYVNIESKVVKIKTKLSGRLCIALSLILAIIITFGVGAIITQYNISQDDGYTDGHTSILNAPALLHSLQIAKADGVVVAIHGWVHEDYSNLTHAEATKNLHNAVNTFNKAGLNTAIFVAPYQVSNVSEPSNVIEDVANAGLTIPFDGAILYEYTWEWRNMTHDTDLRYIEAVKKIEEDNPHIIMVHSQDWNVHTKVFLNNYLAKTKNRNILVRMDDIDANTKPEVIQDMAALRKYSSVGEVVLAVIPAMPLVKNDITINPYIFHVSVNRIMQAYLLFFLVFGTFPLVFFVIWKLITSRFKRESDKQLLKTEIKYPDLLTIIVPAYNEQKSIGRCIESLLNQDYKGAKEIIVVNDGSTDKTAAIASQYPITLLDLKQNVGKASALNEGIKIAKGDIILFSDGDSNMCIDAVSSIMRCFSAHPDADIVTGQVLINKPEKFSFINCCQKIEYHIEQEIVRYLQSLTDEIVVCPGPITAVKRHVCDQIQYTNDTILEDADFSASARESKFMIKLDQYAKIYTNAPETIKQWYKQRTRWWYGNLQVWRIHKKWAITNPWMIYSYLSFVMSLCSLIMILVMPYFVIQYGNIYGFMIKGLICFSILMLINSAMISIFLRHNKMLMLMVVPYMIIYPILKVFVLSYFYVLYITGIGLNIKHGRRHIKAK